MKNVILLLLSVCGMLACTHTPKWELVWEDNFDGAEPDTTIWSRIPRGKPDWQNTQSFDNRCYEMRDGCTSGDGSGLGTSLSMEIKLF